MDASARLKAYVQANPGAIGKVIDLEATDRLLTLDLTAANTELNAGIVSDRAKFSVWIDQQLSKANCRYGIGGFMENRTIYAGIPLFEREAEPRRLHLGVDIWGDADTPVYAPLDGTVHSFNDNANLGDYGPTIILQHNLDGLTLYSLYGHLSRRNLVGLSIGQPIKRDELIADLGSADENGNWPPHLHFQLMLDMEGMSGDYPGACRYSEKEKYLKNIADPGLILNPPEPSVQAHKASPTGRDLEGANE